MLAVLSLFFVPWATAGDLSPEYLYGRWVIDDRDCSSPSSEYMVFHQNGTFESSRTGRAEIVGFWGINKDDMLELHTVTSPAFFDDIHKELAGFKGVYHYLQARMVIFNRKSKSFEAVGVIGNEMQRATAVRCK
jgi:hypothetical protein